MNTQDMQSYVYSSVQGSGLARIPGLVSGVKLVTPIAIGTANVVDRLYFRIPSRVARRLSKTATAITTYVRPVPTPTVVQSATAAVDRDPLEEFPERLFVPPQTTVRTNVNAGSLSDKNVSFEASSPSFQEPAESQPYSTTSTISSQSKAASRPANDNAFARVETQNDSYLDMDKLHEIFIQPYSELASGFYESQALMMIFIVQWTNIFRTEFEATSALMSSHSVKFI